ncbi:hypothetical protein O6H91_16G074800 [Diphasiastrum complanatum]|uniref:Uncharacterized protein n=1 Tax=Diphasiastrum complanatum TaxID=34168 RepID=A0ACC2BDS9_DIPCM|nr:hypothetical protein O6H91_16G074800 [Diphasiastrum complanatum]
MAICISLTTSFNVHQTLSILKKNQYQYRSSPSLCRKHKKSSLLECSRELNIGALQKQRGRQNAYQWQPLRKMSAPPARYTYLSSHANRTPACELDRGPPTSSIAVSPRPSSIVLCYMESNTDPGNYICSNPLCLVLCALCNYIWCPLCFGTTSKSIIFIQFIFS